LPLWLTIPPVGFVVDLTSAEFSRSRTTKCLRHAGRTNKKALSNDAKCLILLEPALGLEPRTC